MSGGPAWPSVSSMAAAVRKGEVGPGHFVAEAMRAIRHTPDLNAFLSLRRGAEAERTPPAPPTGTRGSTGDAGAGGKIPRGQGALAGVPIAVKDNIVTLDMPTTCASRMLEGYRSPFEATVVRRLREAGGVVVGKTNLDEFGMGSSTENSGFGPTRNPLDPDRVPGGSSGGSAAAVAAGLVPVALGSDTGGSVRQPAALCGVVGLKPTYGLVSRYGLVAFASSLDQVGTMARTVEDSAMLLEVVAGHDPRDSTSREGAPPALAEAVSGGVQGLRVGVPREYLPESLDPEIRGLCRRAVDRLRERGAETLDVSLPNTHLAIPAYYVIAPAEASSNLARFDGVRFGHRSTGSRSPQELYERSRSEGFGVEVKRRIMLGTYALSAGYYDAYYGSAQRARARIVADFRDVFQHVDVLFTPTSPTVAFRVGERIEDPVQMYLSDVFTVPANLAGIPALSLPIGRCRGLPVGGQIMAPRWAEASMLRVAGALERALAGEET